MFILDEMKTIIKDSIDEAIGSQQFNHDKVTLEASQSFSLEIMSIMSNFNSKTTK